MKIKKQLIWYYISLHYIEWRTGLKSCIYHTDSFPKDFKRLRTSLWVTYLSYSSPWSVFWKIEAGFFPKSDSGVRAVMSWDSGDISVCVLRGLTLETQEPHQKQKRLLTFFSSCFPPSCCHTMMAFSSPPIVYLSLAFHHSWALTDCIACGVQVSRSRFAWVVMIR